MSDLPLCACGEFYLSHHPECPARRAFEEALSRLGEAREHLQRELDRADEAEARLSRLQTALQCIVDGRFLGYVEAQEIARDALDCAEIGKSMPRRLTCIPG